MVLSSERSKKNQIVFVLGLCISPMLTAGWAEDVLQSMSLREKIGQLFFIAVRSNPESPDVRFASMQRTLDLRGPHDRIYAYFMIQQFHVGGVLFISSGCPIEQHKLTHDLQQQTTVPLMIVQDHEWNLGNLDNTVRFPAPLTLGAIQDPTLLYELGKEIARQCRLIDVHSNLSPVVDINTNPLNPVIGYRSFGENKEKVTQKVYAFFQGLRDGGVLACAKHFPGHGDSHEDSHAVLPTIAHNKTRLESVELYPYTKLIEAQIPLIMTAHLEVPALDPRGGPVSLSSPVVTDLLRTKMQFQGLIITDALAMHGATDGCAKDEVALRALQAGNDILLFEKDVPLALAKIEQAVRSGTVSEKDIDQHVLRILRAKEQLGLHKKQHMQTIVSPEQLNTLPALELKKKLFAHAITLVKNDGILPLKTSERIAVVTVGTPTQFSKSPGKLHDTTLLQQLHTLSNVLTDNFYVPMNCSVEEAESLRKKLLNYTIVLYAVYSMNYCAQQEFGISPQILQLIRANREPSGSAQRHPFSKKKNILALFASPYSLKHFGDEAAIVMAYEDDEDAQAAAARAILGLENPSGKLPVTASPAWKEGTGLHF